MHGCPLWWAEHRRPEPLSLLPLSSTVAIGLAPFSLSPGAPWCCLEDQEKGRVILRTQAVSELFSNVLRIAFTSIHKISAEGIMLVTGEVLNVHEDKPVI